MKKKLALLLTAAVMAATVTACGKEPLREETAATEASASESESAQAGAATDSFDVTAYVDGLETMSLKDIKASDYAKLSGYEGVDVQVAPVNVTEEDVADYINNTLTSSNPILNEVDRPVQDGDTVNIDYVGKYADTKEAFDGGTAQGADLVIGSNSYIEGFESGLIGAELGETRDLNLTFPENYGAADLAGKDVVFTVTVNKISEKSTDLTDEWAAGLGYEDVSNLEELNVHVNKTLTEEAQDRYKQDVENGVLETVTNGTEFSELPEKLVNRYMKQQVEQLTYYATMYSYMYGQQLTATDVLKLMMQSSGFTGTEEEYFKKTAGEMADQYVMFQAIADEQGINITDEDVDSFLKEKFESASSTGFSTFEDYKASLDLELYRENLMAEKVMAFLSEHANVVEAAE